MKKILIALVLLSFTNCAHSQHTVESELPKGDQFETLAILGTNDIHGTVVPTEQKTHDAPGTPSITYDVGGLATLASYIRSLQHEFPGHLVWLDAGDEFQGSLESNLNGGRPLVEFFNNLGLTAAAVGNHEFDFGVPVLESRMVEARYPYLASNILDKKTGKYADFPNSKPRMITQVGKLKVGIFGLSTLETLTTTRPDNVEPYSFEDLKTATLRESEALRKDGADVVVLVAHVGLFCDNHFQPENRLRTALDPQGKCNPNDEMSRLLNSIPPGTLDAVVAGHTHQITHHWVNGTPVIQSAAYSRYLSLIYLTYDWSTHRVVEDATRIEGPIPVCEKVFKNRQDCNGDVQDPNRGPLGQANFRGIDVHADSETAQLLSPFVEKIAAVKAQIVGQAARAVEHSRQAESEMGNLLADAVRVSAHTDIAILNSGGIRAPWESGPITYGSVYRTVPFDNFITTLQLKGRELKLLLAITESGSKGISPISGAKIEMLPLNDKNAPSKDLNGDGKIEPWEFNRILKVTFDNGKSIQDSKTYTVATLDFLVHGGDDWGWMMNKIGGKQVGKKSGKLERDALLDYLQHEIKRPINSAEHPLIDPRNPRFIFKQSE